MAEVVFSGEVTGYGSYDNDPPGYDIAYPNSRHPQTGVGTTATCWGTAFGDGSWEYPLAMAGDANRHPAGTVAYDEVSKKYYEMVDYCAACQAPANARLDLYVGGDLSPTAGKINTVDTASSNLTRIPGSTQVGRRLILNPNPGKPVVLGPYSGISSGCGNVGPARTGGVSPPPPPLPPPPPPPPSGATLAFLRLKPQARTGSSGPQGANTSAAKVLSRSTHSNPIFRHGFLTSRQLRSGAVPNLWEVVWVIWNHDTNINVDTNFLYFLPKPNGWELGQVTPTQDGTNQRDLVLSSTPKFPIGKWYDVEVTQSGQRIVVKVNGTQIVDFTDSKSLLPTSGRVGFYVEDCEAYYTNVTSPFVDTFAADVGFSTNSDGAIINANWQTAYLGFGDAAVVATSPIAYISTTSPPPPPSPPPSPPPLPPPPPQTCPGQTITVPSNGYSWVSNGGTSIAYTGAYARPNGQNTAQGNGDWDNPHTLAVSTDLQSTSLMRGSKVYIDRVVHGDNTIAEVKAYAVVEDFAVGTNNVVLWVGGAGNNGTRDTISSAKLTKGESWVTGQMTIIYGTGLTSSCPVPFVGRIANNPAVT